MGTFASNADMLNLVKFMSDLSPEESQRVRSAYAFIKNIDKGGSNTMAMIPSLLGYAKQNPGASEGDMIKYLTLMDSQFSKGLELAKAVTPKQEADSTIKYLNLMDGQFSKGLEIARAMNPGPAEDGLLKAVTTIKELLPFIQPFLRDPSANQGFFDQVFTNPDTYARMQGIFGGGSATAKNQYDLDIERLRGERELDGRKWDLEMRKIALQSEERMSRNETVMQALGPLSTILAGPVAQRMGQLGEQQGMAYQPPSSIPPVAPPTGTTILLKCDCGHEGPMNFPGEVPLLIKCPNCNHNLVVGGAPTGKAP